MVVPQHRLLWLVSAQNLVYSTRYQSTLKNNLHSSGLSLRDSLSSSSILCSLAG
jgi:hypothetical protein